MRNQAAKKYVICIKNEGYEASLERRKIYRIKPDKAAAEKDLIRVVDESGESYLYPIDCFIPFKFPPSIIKALAA